MPFRVAIVQFKIAHLRPDENFRRIERFIRRAVQKRAKVIVFPEDCVTGSIFGDLSKLDCGHATRETFRRLARAYQIDIVTGSSMEGTNEGNFNTSYYIDASGEALAMYRKNHLYPSERAFLTPGIETPVFDTAYGKAGIVICWDMLFPEIFERLRSQGTQIVYCPSYWYREIADNIPGRDPKSEERLLDALCLTRAVETNAALIYCDAAGTANNPDGSVDTLIGHSQITVPGRGTIKRLSHNREVMLIEDISIDTLPLSEQIYHG